MGQIYTITAQDNETKATFLPEKGGMCVSLVAPGKQGPRELLFQYPHLWDMHSRELPGAWFFCFPICGRLERQGIRNAYLYNGKLFELPMHGFARYKSWKVTDAGNHYIHLTLRDDEETRQHYPFHFTVELHYEIAHRRLFCRQTYTNHGENRMPYYAGFHPYFLTPEDVRKKEVILNFSPRRRFRYNPQLTDLVGEQPLFNLPTSIANPEIHEQLTELGEDKEIHLEYPGGDLIQMAAEGVEDHHLFPYVQLFSPPNMPFICVEPWMGFPNAMNTMQGVRWLDPLQSEHGICRLWME